MKTRTHIPGFRASYLAVFLLAAFGFFSACNKIDEPYLIKAENTDTAACPAPQFPVVTNHVKRVLLEDYTGHICVNCPGAAVIAENLKEEYGDKLVLISVHAGSNAKAFASGNYTYDFNTPAGTAWDTEFGISTIGNPNGMVNRRKISNTFVISPAAWSGAVAEMVAEAPVLDIQVINEFSESEDKLCTHIQTQFLQPIDKNLKLIVALTEDSIVAPQKNNNAQLGPPDILDYVHMHAMRGTITSIWGSTISTSGVANPSSIIKSYRYPIPDKMVPKNCRVVAFVYDADTYEVLQAAEANVIGK